MNARFSAVILLLFSLLVNTHVNAQKPFVSLGTIDRYDSFPSRYIKSRTIDIWKPKEYNPQKKYAVVYMHDGQMLFDSATTWNHQEWGVDETLSSLMENDIIQGCIVVGIFNGGADRHREYCPQKPFESLAANYKDSLLRQGKRQNGSGIFSGRIISDDHLKFIVKELKPFVDQHYSTFKDRSHTFIGGSSMGGLISLYAICEYPKIFGGAICMSTHWPLSFSAENNPFPQAMFDYMRKKLPDPKRHKIYFDYGDQTLDAMYPTFQLQADQIMRLKGYDEKSWESLFFKGDDHSERSWSRRLHAPFEFMLKK